MARQSLFLIFKNPPSEFRGVPFWSWNSKLEPQELRRQIRIMKQMGLGGFFMHARVGLATPYLSKEWFKCIRACINEAEKLGMRAWLYDEDRWPSGFAGGLLTKDRRYRMRRLKLTQITDPEKLSWTSRTRGAFLATIEGFDARGVRSISPGSCPLKLKKNESILLFTEEVEPPSSWYNGYAYLDTLNPEAVKNFITVTHEAYRREVGKKFGKVVPGIFTDEPNHGGKLRRWDGNQLPWTSQLPAIFKKRYGYDLLPHLPCLFFNVDREKISQVRYHYHECVTYLFVNSFARQIGEWCEKNGLLFTGHVLSEESLSGQSSVVGDCMRFYQYMQAPGMDVLTETNREFDTAKQVSSVARQFARRWRLSETYGCTGWSFTFRDQKALSDWQAALGINLRCQHLAWYSMLGEAKRDFPASISFQSPWWDIYRKVEDYYGRIHAVMTRGEEVRDLLVIHPVESMWLLMKKDWQDDPQLDPMEYAHVALRDTLLGANIDFDYGSEEILSHHARVCDQQGQPIIQVGKASYRAVVVPPMLTIRHSTLKLLKQFKQRGGIVVFAGPPPSFIDAVASDEAEIFSRSCIRCAPKGKSLIKAVESYCRRLSILDNYGREIEPALYLLREDKKNFYLFVCNTGQPFRPFGANQITQLRVEERTLSFPQVFIWLFTPCKGTPLELDPDTGETFRADFSHKSEGVVIRTSLPRLGSRMFLIPKKEQRCSFQRRQILTPVRTLTLTKGWTISCSEPNPIVLDRPFFRIGEGAWENPCEILVVDRRVRQSMGIEPRSGSMIQPWARQRPHRLRRIGVQLRYSFIVQQLPTGDLFLALEQPHTFRIFINNHRIDSSRINGWWVDPSLQKIVLPSNVLLVGQNEVLLECDYDENHSGLETIYLLGNFGVQLHATQLIMTALPKRIHCGNWTTQGFPFYSGAIDYIKIIRLEHVRKHRLFVVIPNFKGSAIRVMINGVTAGIIAWEPQEIDITNNLIEGDNEIRLQVISHRRNSHGPLHLRDRHPSWIGPDQFDVEKYNSTDEYQLVPCGLMTPPRLEWRCLKHAY